MLSDAVKGNVDRGTIFLYTNYGFGFVNNCLIIIC